MVIEPQEVSDDTGVQNDEVGKPIEEVKPHALGMPLYLMVFLTILTLLYVAPLFMARTEFYERSNLSYYARPLSYAYHTAGENADVVLFGDSTALLGIDPSQIARELSIKVVNLPNTHGSLVVNDDMALRHYLAGNHAPRLIVFYFAPWDFDYGHVPVEATPVYEGEELLMRQGSFGQILAFIGKHPLEGVSFPLRFYEDSLQFALHKVSHQGQEKRLLETHGHIDNTDATSLTSPCAFPSLLLDHVRFDWVKALGSRYATPQTRVLYFVAPVPICSNLSALLNHPYHTLPAALPLQMPPEVFVNDIRYIHPHPDAVPQITHNLADAVGAMLQPSAGK